MCKMASFLWRQTEEEGLQIKVWNLTSHSDTQKKYNLTETLGWYEGHYTPKGEIEMRTPEGDNKEARRRMLVDYPTFNSFLNWALSQGLDINGWLDLSECDLKGIKWPKSIVSLDLSECDLKGIKWPKSIDGWLYLSRCDLTGINIPSKFKVIK